MGNGYERAARRRQKPAIQHDWSHLNRGFSGLFGLNTIGGRFNRNFAPSGSMNHIALYENRFPN